MRFVPGTTGGLESHKGTGVGSLVMQDALRHAEDLGEAVVILGIPTTTRALALCQRPGCGSLHPKGLTFLMMLGWPGHRPTTDRTCVERSRIPRTSSRREASRPFATLGHAPLGA